jgi:hypothetical protein
MYNFIYLFIGGTGVWTQDLMLPLDTLHQSLYVFKVVKVELEAWLKWASASQDEAQVQTSVLQKKKVKSWHTV